MVIVYSRTFLPSILVLLRHLHHPSSFPLVRFDFSSTLAASPPVTLEESVLSPALMYRSVTHHRADIVFTPVYQPVPLYPLPCAPTAPANIFRSFGPT